MIKAGGPGAEQALSAKMALDSNNLKYLEIRQSFDKFGNTLPVQVNEFNIKPQPPVK
jgi:hypothetical protein